MFAFVLGAVPASAQDITYQPVDPTFGGNPFNSAHLLGVANAQNDYKDPESDRQQLSGRHLRAPAAIAIAFRAVLANRRRDFRRQSARKRYDQVWRSNYLLRSQPDRRHA